jgi:hypothetical protein
MRRVGQARRRDANEKAIRSALEAAGATVTPISGKGAPDLLVRFRGQLYAFEVKGAKGKQTAAQQRTDWPIVRTDGDALAAIGAKLSRSPGRPCED